MRRLWTSKVTRYYFAVLFASLIIDVGFEPFLNLHHYTSIWHVTGVLIRGDPLLVYVQYPVTAALWVGVPRLIQLRTDWSWRQAYYSGFIALAVVEELINEFVVRFWRYTDTIARTGDFWLDLPVIVLFGWVTWAVLGDILATSYSRIVPIIVRSDN